MINTQNLVKYLIWILTVIILRLLPHPPNVEPIMSTMMPFSKKWWWFSGMIFCLFSILIYDLLTGTLWVWTFVTAWTYAFLWICASLYLKNKENKIKYYVIFSVIATIIYDGITWIGIWIIFFNQSFITTFLWQIPFTLYHLWWNIILSIIVSPILYKWVIDNSELETTQILHKITLCFK